VRVRLERRVRGAGVAVDQVHDVRQRVVVSGGLLALEGAVQQRRDVLVVQLLEAEQRRSAEERRVHLEERISVWRR